MNVLRVFFLICFFMCTLIFTMPVLASPAQEQLKASIDKILLILKDPSLKGEEKVTQRRQALRCAIDERFSFKKMSQFSLARHWKTISPVQQEKFVELFGKLLEETYVSKIESYTNEKIEYTGESVSKKKAKIYSQVIADDIKIPIEYRMFKASKDNWMIYDMLIEGISLIKNYRTQFDDILQKDSFEELLEELQKRSIPKDRIPFGKGTLLFAGEYCYPQRSICDPCSLRFRRIVNIKNSSLDIGFGFIAGNIGQFFSDGT